MRLTSIASATLIAGVLSVSAATAQSLPADFVKARNERVEALAKGDRATFDKLTTDTFVVADAMGRVETKAQRAERVVPPQNPPQGGPAQRMNEHSAMYNNNTVVLFWQQMGGNGTMNFMETWVKDGAQWKCAAAHVSRPAAPGAGREGGREGGQGREGQGGGGRREGGGGN